MPYENRGDRRGWDNRGGGNRGGGFQTYPNSGSMHARQKRSQNAADMGGDFLLSDDVLDYVINQANLGGDVKLEISAWRRQSRSGNTFWSLKIQTPYSERGGQQRGNYQNRNSRYDPGPQQRSQYGDRAERDQYGPRRQRDDDRGDPRGNRYAQASRGYDERNPPQMAQDQLPGFMRDNDLDDEIPF